MATHRYWKVNVVATGNGNFGFSEMAMAESVGGTNRCGSGTPTASSDDGVNHIAGGFDGNSSTMYGASGGLPRFVTYDFGSGSAYDIKEVRVSSRTDGNYQQNITAATLYYSDDGTNFFPAFALLGDISTSNGQAISFSQSTYKGCTPAPSSSTTPVPVAAVLQGGVVGTAYSETISAVGGTSPYTYAVTSGSLPGGLSLNSSTGVISGTPTTAATASFTITATDAASSTGATAFNITIAASGGTGGGNYGYVG